MTSTSDVGDFFKLQEIKNSVLSKAPENYILGDLHSNQLQLYKNRDKLFETIDMISPSGDTSLIKEIENLVTDEKYRIKLKSSLFDELGLAYSRNWDGFDGRTVKEQLAIIASYVTGEDDEIDKNIVDMRKELGLCEYGCGSWSYSCIYHSSTS